MMNDPSSESGQRSERPGKTRTLWHPLLVRLLRFSLSSAYTVVDEVLVGKMPLRVDILLVRREGKDLPDSKQREVASLLPLLNRFTLIEFKGPTDALEFGDFAQLVGCAFLWYSQQSERLSHDDVSLVVLGPTITGPFREELRLLGCEAAQEAPGIHRIAGLPFSAWLVETDVMGQNVEPVLSTVSRVFLKDYRSIIKELSLAGLSNLANYVLQQVQYIHTHREDFAVQAEVVDEFAKLHDGMVADLLESLPPEQILRSVPLAKLLRGVSPEERLAGISDEDKARLAELLKQERRG
jgi:hypothetical protein